MPERDPELARRVLRLPSPEAPTLDDDVELVRAMGALGTMVSHSLWQINSHYAIRGEWVSNDWRISHIVADYAALELARGWHDRVESARRYRPKIDLITRYNVQLADGPAPTPLEIERDQRYDLEWLTREAGNAAYDAAVRIEDLEHLNYWNGNGHHAAQNVHAFTGFVIAKAWGHTAEARQYLEDGWRSREHARLGFNQLGIQ